MGAVVCMWFAVCLKVAMYVYSFRESDGDAWMVGRMDGLYPRSTFAHQLGSEMCICTCTCSRSVFLYYSRFLRSKHWVWSGLGWTGFGWHLDTHGPVWTGLFGILVGGVTEWVYDTVLI